MSISDRVNVLPMGLRVTARIGEFCTSFFFWVNLVGVAVQLFLVSRILKHVGVSGAPFFLLVISLAGYSLIAFLPILAYIQLAKQQAPRTVVYAYLGFGDLFQALSHERFSSG